MKQTSSIPNSGRTNEMHFKRLRTTELLTISYHTKYMYVIIFALHWLQAIEAY